MLRRQFITSSASVFLASCAPATKPAQTWRLFTVPDQTRWIPSAMSAPGEVTWQENVLSLGAGQPMTGIHWPRDLDLGVPWDRYRMTFEARRLTGNDFFATVTFPVDHLDDAVSLVLGGWGGSLIGISCIDGYDASENSTTSYFDFKNSHWYHFKIEVSKRWLKVWQDQRLIIQTNLKGRQLSLRGGEIVHCLPLGFATYLSHGEIRHFEIQEILP